MRLAIGLLLSLALGSCSILQEKDVPLLRGKVHGEFANALLLERTEAVPTCRICTMLVVRALPIPFAHLIRLVYGTRNTSKEINRKQHKSHRRDRQLNTHVAFSMKVVAINMMSVRC